MKLYLFERTENIGYDEYDGAVILAKDKEEALELADNLNWEGNGNYHSSNNNYYKSKFKNKVYGYEFFEIGKIDTELGSQILMESYNAG